MDRLTLYHMPHCTHCRTVRHVADKLGTELALVDVSTDREAVEALHAATGARRVPVLRIHEDGADPGDDRWMPESLVIVRELKRRAGVAEPVPAWLDGIISRGMVPGVVALLLAPTQDGPAQGFLMGVGTTLLVAPFLRRLFL